jgi:hypothetical protein
MPGMPREESREWRAGPSILIVRRDTGQDLNSVAKVK